MEYALRLENGWCATIDLIASALERVGPWYEIEHPSCPNRRFIVAPPKTHVEAWSMISESIKIFKTKNAVAPSWIEEMARVEKLR